MGSLFTSSHKHQELLSNHQGINQAYAVRYGYAPVGPVGRVVSTPKRSLDYPNVRSHRRRLY